MITIDTKGKMVMLDIATWTGRTALSESDLKLAPGSELPPPTLARLGSKLIFDPKNLLAFKAVKMQAHRVCLRSGTRFLGGYLIPSEKIEKTLQELYELEAKFNSLKGEFEKNYQGAVEAWIEENPAWRGIIENSTLSGAEAASRLKFNVQAFCLSPTGDQEADKRLEEHASGLAASMRDEIQVEARQVWKQSFEGRVEAGQKSIRPIRAMLDKMDGLSFLEPSIGELVRSLTASLGLLPPSGKIEGRDFATLTGIVALLGNIPQKIQKGPADPQEDQVDPQEETVGKTKSTTSVPAVWF